MRLGMLLRLWRRRQGFTLRAAAERVGIHPSTLARVEHGEQMHGDTLATLLLWVLGREEWPVNETLAFASEDAAAAAPQSAAECSTERFEDLEQFAGEAAAIAAEESADEAGRPAAPQVAQEPEAGAELPVHALDQDAALRDLRPAGS